ncbi:MAG: DUF4293 domain-containing protein [Dysgonamonadaceae bacterium]|jgi:hypothetical protein|nr:DUF4293 domain-containing protein [Dysgonamonadaceae bacterium]
MIQRIQTVWLFLIALLNAGWFFLPVVKAEATGAFPYSRVGSAGAGLTALLALAVILLYKRRPLQTKGCWGILALQLAWAGTAIFATGWSFSLLLPLISLVLVVLAMRAIRKDEKLVRSLDRLR